MDSKRAAVVFTISIVSGTLSNYDITSLYDGQKLTPFSVLKEDLSTIPGGLDDYFLFYWVSHFRLEILNIIFM